MIASLSTCDKPLAKLQAAFLAILPTIERVARRHLGHLDDPGDRDDASAEVIALCWKWFCDLWQRGRDARRFPAVLAYFAVRQVRCGRHLCGLENSKDVLSRTARIRRRFRLEQLREHGAYEDLGWQEALTDNTRSAVPEQAAFRIDFPAWLRGLGRRNRRVVETMIQGDGTFSLARRLQISPARISQLRREFHKNWQRFHGEAGTENQLPAAA